MKPASEAALPLLLKSLCLPTFAREYAPMAVKAEREGLSHQQLIGKIMDSFLKRYPALAARRAA